MSPPETSKKSRRTHKRRHRPATSPHHTTKKATQTFHPFMRLPNELQIEILRLALNEEDPDHERGRLSRYSYWGFDQHQFPQQLTGPKSDEEVSFYLMAKGGPIVGANFMRACRWTRLVAFQIWAGEMRLADAVQLYDVHRKQHILMILAELIDELKERLQIQ